MPDSGRVVGEFVLEEQIGGGGGGSVFRAYQPVLQRNAVVKLLHANGEQALVDQFLREARLASRLDHPFAAHVYAFGAEADGLLWIAMEIVRGTPLSELLAGGPLDRGLAFVERVCEVVQSTHELGIIHGDLKPSNIMVISRVGSLFPKLIDFGIARDSSDRTSGGLGTPAYMAPEQWVSGQTLTPATDVYALGALTFEILTGNPPFTGRSRMELATHHARSAPPTLPAEFPSRISAAITKAMAKQPAERFASAVEFARALNAGSEEALAAIHVPRIDELTRDDALLGAPEPIAEAVARLDAASDPESAYAAMRRLVETIAQYIGVVALGCRARVRAGAIASEHTTALLRELRTSGLDARGWWRLARELVRPFAVIRDVHPVPELVGLFFDGRAEIMTALDLVFAEGGSAIAPNREVAEAALARIVPMVGVALRTLRRFDDYRLVVPMRARAQLWVGVRRRDRLVVDLGRQLERPALVGRENTIVVDLGDVVTVAEPAPGAPRELFFLDGPGRSGARFRAIRRSSSTTWPGHGSGWASRRTREATTGGPRSSRRTWDSRRSPRSSPRCSSGANASSKRCSIGCKRKRSSASSVLRARARARSCKRVCSRRSAPSGGQSCSGPARCR